MLRFKNSIIFILRLNFYYLKFLRSVLSSPWELQHASCESRELISIRSFETATKSLLLKNPKSTLKTEGKTKGEKAATVPIISNKFAAPMAKHQVMIRGRHMRYPGTPWYRGTDRYHPVPHIDRVPRGTGYRDEEPRCGTRGYRVPG